MSAFFVFICFVVKIIYANVTHTLMESCCVEEFFPSAEIEGIWGFTSAMAMVGGVSLVIFFSLFKWIDVLKKKKGQQMRCNCSRFSTNTEIRCH